MFEEEDNEVGANPMWNFNVGMWCDGGYGFGDENGDGYGCGNEYILGDMLGGVFSDGYSCGGTLSGDGLSRPL
jgi:hypothetical protein